MDHFTQNAKPTSGTDKMMLCDLDPDDPNITTKTISLTFHIFQKDDGTGNITEAEGWRAIDWRLVNAANQHFANLQPMSFSSPSLYFQDAKIRFAVEEKYFWQNDDMWSRGNNTLTNGNALYDFIINRPEVVNKYNTIHVFITGDDPNDFNALKGRASNVGPTLYSGYFWLHLSNVHYFNATGNSNGQASNLRHEVGHNINLFHTWQDQIPDTPPSSSMWDNGSNNMMDYNPHQIALTVDQFTRMHDYLADHPEIIISGYQPSEPELSYNVTSNGTNGTNSGTTNFGAPSGTIDVLNDTDNPLSWTVLNSGDASAGVNISSDGSHLSFYGLGWVSMKVDWVDKCREYTDAVYVYNSVGYYRLSQDPGDNETVEVFVPDEEGVGDYRFSKTGESNRKRDHQIEAVVLADALGRVVKYDNLDSKGKSNIRLNWKGLNKGVILGSLITSDGRKFSLKTIKH